MVLNMTKIIIKYCRMKTLLTLFVLLFSSSVFADDLSGKGVFCHAKQINYTPSWEKDLNMKLKRDMIIIYFNFISSNTVNVSYLNRDNNFFQYKKITLKYSTELKNINIGAQKGGFFKPKFKFVINRETLRVNYGGIDLNDNDIIPFVTDCILKNYSDIEIKQYIDQDAKKKNDLIKRQEDEYISKEKSKNKI